ncbi:uncharacterized protein LOC120780276 [Bactrocera tryoni]|uniref:uncharacterized protein LOC120780276 n=1 Tax=Bactrocera tryoni TaxID=59916 RepID=UPI001A973A71|nr:uncharacterized protein LOC120780276 [Bactrocera tryoni]
MLKFFSCFMSSELFGENETSNMGKHKTQMQDNVFVEFMKLNQDLARGFIKGDRTIAADKWHALVCKLNAAGPPIKDIAGWKKVRLDWKMHVRKKLAHNKNRYFTN